MASTLATCAREPWVPKQISVRGFVYDVKTGKLKEVAEAAGVVTDVESGNSVGVIDAHEIEPEIYPDLAQHANTATTAVFARFTVPLEPVHHDGSMRRFEAFGDDKDLHSALFADGR